MLENIRNVITRQPMNRLRPDLGDHITSCPRHVPTIRLPWQQPLPSNGTLIILQLWTSAGQTREPILMKFGLQQQIRTTMTVTWSNITNGPTGSQLGWSHPIMPSTCSPWCGCHGNGRCLATAVAWQRRIVHSTVMGVWRANASTNFGEIWYTTAN